MTTLLPIRGYDQGGVDGEPATDAAPPVDDAPAPAPEAGEAYGYEHPQPTQEETEQEEAEKEPEGDKEPEDAKGDKPKADAAPEAEAPKDDRFGALETENRELRVRLDKALALAERFAPQSQPQAQKAIRKYQQLMQQQVEAGHWDKAAAGRLQQVIDALVEEMDPRLSKLDEHAEYSQQQMAQAAAQAEEREATDMMRATYGATDAEINAARNFARTEFRNFADGKTRHWPGSYGSLFERSLARQRHGAHKQAVSDDEGAAKLRREAQRRADPAAGTHPSNKTGVPRMPKDAVGNQRLQEQFWKDQGLLVDG
jgi:hypothetical protein